MIFILLWQLISGCDETKRLLIKWMHTMLLVKVDWWLKLIDDKNNKLNQQMTLSLELLLRLKTIEMQDIVLLFAPNVYVSK